MKRNTETQPQYLTKTVTLPVSGLEAEIREGDGYAERILYGNNKPMREVLPEFWAHLTARLGETQPVSRDDILGLTIPDQHVLAIEIYRLNYGDTLELAGTCDRCGEPAGYEVDLGKLPLMPLPADAVPPDPTFEVVLPRTGRRVKFGYVTGKDELENSSSGEFDTVRLNHRAIRTIDGATVSYEEVRRLPLADQKALRKGISSKVCGYDTTVRFVHQCGRRLVVDILTDPSFFMPGLVV
ncbi:MAG: hypothetical protein AB1646_25280 [Thermodesulfobacteriota bacterium]